MLGSENSAAHPGRHFEEWPIGKARALGARSCRFDSCFLDHLTGDGVVMELKVVSNNQVNTMAHIDAGRAVHGRRFDSCPFHKVKP